MYWKVTEREGKLAIEMPYMAEQNRPVESRPVAVSNIRIDNWTTLIGRDVEFNGDDGMVRGENGKRFYINTRTWEHITEEKPIKPPRKGKEYHWIWRYGHWAKEWD